MPKCGFSNFNEIAIQHGYSPTNFLHTFGTSSYNNTSGGLLLNSKRSEKEAVAQTCSVKKVFLRNFAKFTGKHLCQSLFFNKVAGGGCNFI